MQTAKQGFATIMRADGTVPFEPPEYDSDGKHVAGVHPDHRAAILADLVETGHAVTVDQATGAVTITAGPMIDQRNAAQT